MSSFTGNPADGTSGVDGSLRADDIRLWPEWADTSALNWVDPDDQFALNGFHTPWWPRTTVTTSGQEWLEPSWTDWPEITRGHTSRMTFSGVTRDAYGSPLGGCTVKLFKTAAGTFPGQADTLVDTTISDPTTGAFLLYSIYYPDTHYIVSYKAGTPDVEGTTVNTLIGA